MQTIFPDGPKQALVMQIVAQLPADGVWTDCHQAERFRKALIAAVDLVAPSPDPPLINPDADKCREFTVDEVRRVDDNYDGWPVAGAMLDIAERAGIDKSELPSFRFGECAVKAMHDGESLEIHADGQRVLDEFAQKQAEESKEEQSPPFDNIVPQDVAPVIEELIKTGGMISIEFPVKRPAGRIIPVTEAYPEPAQRVEVIVEPAVEVEALAEEQAPSVVPAAKPPAAPKTGWCQKHDQEFQSIGHGKGCRECHGEKIRAAKARAKSQSSVETTNYAVVKPAEETEVVPIEIDIQEIAEFDPTVVAWSIEAVQGCIRQAATYKKAQDLGQFFIVKDGQAYRAVVQGLRDDAEVVLSFTAVRDPRGWFGGWQACSGMWTKDKAIVNVPASYYAEVKKASAWLDADED